MTLSVQAGLMFSALFAAAVLSAPVANNPHSLPNQPVPTLDIARYVGEWHEVAHLPNYFQRKCSSDVTATYSLLPSGNLRVVNACKTDSGKFIASNGEARKPDGTPAGALKVRFAPAWLTWLPWVWADYWVIDLDGNYQWAVIGSPSHKYLWILSRTNGMDQQLYQNLVKRAAQRGYPVDQLHITAPIR